MLGHCIKKNCAMKMRKKETRLEGLSYPNDTKDMYHKRWKNWDNE